MRLLQTTRPEVARDARARRSPKATITLLLALLLCTCGPAPDSCTDCTPEEAIAKAEELYHSAYENLDAAVMERLLSVNFVASYPDQEMERDKAAFIDELSQLSIIFPELTIVVDSSGINPYRDNYIVSGNRTYSWQQGAQKGSYRERFVNNWEREPDGWRLIGSKVNVLR